VCESRLRDGSWRDILACAAQYGVPPALIVAAPGADRRLSAEVADCGGAGVLRKPFHGREVRRAIAWAWHHSLRGMEAGGASVPSVVMRMGSQAPALRASARFSPFRAN